MTQASMPPEGGGRSVDIKAELTALRERLRLIDEIDRQTTEMVERLAEAVRSSAEMRAQANLEVGAAVDRLERLVSERESRQREAMAALQQDVTVLHARAIGLGAAVTGFESVLTGLQSRLADADQQAAPEETPAAPAAEPEQVGTPLAESASGVPMPPLPSATSTFVEVERVPSAGAALSIQRFVSDLPRVVAATTREYAAGHLRLEVRTRGPISADELQNWPGGELELVGQEAGSLRFRIAD